MRIDYKNIYLHSFQEENLERCSQSRITNSYFFFSEVENIKQSCTWITNHINNIQDTLLEIHLKENNAYIGAIGYKIENGRCEVGRFTLDIPYLRKNISLYQLANQFSPTKEACIAMLSYLYNIIINQEEIFARVLASNNYSNSLCSFFSDICETKTINLNNQKCYEYIINKEKFLEKYNEEKVFILYS